MLSSNESSPFAQKKNYQLRTKKHTQFTTFNDYFNEQNFNSKKDIENKTKNTFESALYQRSKTESSLADEINRKNIKTEQGKTEKSTSQYINSQKIIQMQNVYRLKKSTKPTQLIIQNNFRQQSSQRKVKKTPVLQIQLDGIKNRVDQMLTTWKNKEKQYINNQKGLENEIKRLQSIIKLYEKAFGAPPL